MNVTKDCSLFKDLYPSYLDEDLEEGTIEWMKEHLKSCSSCKKWKANYAEEIVLENEYSNKTVPMEQQEIKIIKRARIFLIIGITIVVALALWMSLWIVS